MSSSSLSGHAAVAWGARLALVNYILGFAASPAIDIIDILADWIKQGEMDGSLSILETEDAMYSAAAIAASNGQRVFAVTTGKHLMLALNLIHAASNWRVPMVMFNLIVSDETDTLSAPDHNTALAARDSGFIQFYCASCQEVLDTVLLAYRLSEDETVRLPVLISLDRHSLRNTHEEVEIPNVTAARQFIGSRVQQTHVPEILTIGSHVDMDIKPGSGFRFSMHLASQQALTVYDELAEEFRDFFGRYYPAIESHSCDDAEFVFIVTGACLCPALEATRQLRESGWKVGVLRPRLLRPFPQDRLIHLLHGKRAVAVIDDHLSPGKGGVLHGEIVSALYGQHGIPPIVASFLVRQCDQEISVRQFLNMAEELREAVDTGTALEPRILAN